MSFDALGTCSYALGLGWGKRWVEMIEAGGGAREGRSGSGKSRQRKKILRSAESRVATRVHERIHRVKSKGGIA